MTKVRYYCNCVHNYTGTQGRDFVHCPRGTRSSHLFAFSVSQKIAHRELHMRWPAHDGVVINSPCPKSSLVLCRIHRSYCCTVLNLALILSNCFPSALCIGTTYLHLIAKISAFFLSLLE